MKDNHLPLQVKDLSKDYGSFRAVNQVSFDLMPGEIFGLLGPNGAGKTTIISTITTLEKPTSGSIHIFGLDISKKSKIAKTKLGIVPQELINHGYFSVEELLHFHSGYYGLFKNTSRIEYLLEKLSLIAHRKKKVRELSGGLKRRFLIAKALVHNPKLLILDEPTAGVDITLRTELWDFVLELKEQGTTILLTTHYLEEAENLCDRIAFIDHGKIVKIGHTKELIDQLTKREVSFSFRSPITKLIHPQLTEQSTHSARFTLSQTQNIGELLHDINIDLKQLKDISIKEGNLENAFTRIIGGANGI